MNNVPPAALRRALGSFATGVTIVTARGSAGDVGVTANSFSSVSLEPPMVLWSLNKSSASLAAFTDSGAFAVHVLAAHQQALSDRFASRTTDRFAGLAISRGYGGAPLLDDCAARFQCRLAFRYDGGDHDILVGEIVEFDHSNHPPLVFHGGRYGAINVPAPRSADDADEAGELVRLVGRAYHRLFFNARQEFARRELTDEAYYVLRILGREEPQSFNAIARVVARAGRRLTADIMQNLQQRGLIAAAVPDAFRLTSDGRRTVIELAAVGLSGEQAALAQLDRSEISVLKDLMRRLAQ
jgi:3-hydroxy-9,10-secoandrosta-1,3,5(10)-triene-9,17-dione monooxygenase reductase component